MTLRRGFASQAERTSTELREAMHRKPNEWVDPRDFARHRGIPVISASHIVPIERLEELEQIQAFAFSAATFELDSGRTVIVTNPVRDAGRTNSDIAHELAHIILGHELSEIEEFAGQTFRTCSPGQEEEATALGGAILLPRRLLLNAVSEGLSVDQIARRYKVTLNMARYRVNTTGVLKQVRRYADPQLPPHDPMHGVSRVGNVSLNGDR